MNLSPSSPSNSLCLHLPSATAAEVNKEVSAVRQKNYSGVALIPAEFIFQSPEKINLRNIDAGEKH